MMGSERWKVLLLLLLGLWGFHAGIEAYAPNTGGDAGATTVCQLAPKAAELRDRLLALKFGLGISLYDAQPEPLHIDGRNYWIALRNLTKQPFIVFLRPLAEEPLMEPPATCGSWGLFHKTPPEPDSENGLDEAFQAIAKVVCEVVTEDFPLPPDRCPTQYLGPWFTWEEGVVQFHLETGQEEKQDWVWRGFALLAAGWLIWSLLGSRWNPEPWWKTLGIGWGVIALAVWVMGKMAWYWPSPACAIPWMVVLAASAVYLVGGFVRSGWAGLALGAAWMLGLYLRLTAEGFPANWFAYFREHPLADRLNLPCAIGGCAGLFRLPAYLVPVSSDTIFHVMAFIGSLIAPLLGLAVLRRAGEGKNAALFSTAGALLIALAGALDPIMIRLSASDASHIIGVALFAFGACCLAEYLRSGSPAWLGGMAVSSTLMGLTRPEYLLAGVVWLSLSGWGRFRRSPGEASAPLVFLAWACSLGAAAGATPLRALHATFQWENPRNWEIFKHTFNFPPASATGLNQVFWWMMAVWAVEMVARRHWRLLLLFPAILLEIGPKTLSGFGRGLYPVTSIVTVRYELPELALNGIFFAGGVLALIRWSGLFLPWIMQRSGNTFSPELLRKIAPLAAAGLVGILFLSGRPGLPVARQKMSFQAEFQFLKKAIRTLPANSNVAFFWPRNPRGAGDFDVCLLLPHFLLSYDRPDLRWIPLSEEGIPEAGFPREFYFFQNGYVSLDEGRLEAIGKRGEEIRIVQTFRQMTEEILRYRVETVAEENLAGEGLFYQFKEKEIPLGLYRIERHER